MTAQYTTPGLEASGRHEGLSSIDGLPVSSKSNALSNKINSVLSASYADSEIRNALALLDARGTTNTMETRRNLRLDAQKEVIDCNVAILDEFGQVAEQLKRVGAMIATLNNTCDQMRKHIVMAKSDSAPMLDEASTLVASQQESETKQAVLNAFTKHFIVADEDLDILTSSAVPLNDQFFDVLDRVKKIHDDCEPLLGSENERLGLELMEQTSRNLDAGFKKLYNWVQRALKGLDFEDPKISGSIRRALRVLSERPTLFQNCLEFLAEAREQTLSDAFQMALSGVGDGSGSAIEFSAHDLLRYMGDMLAWVHSTTVSEKESLEGLFIADAEAIARGMKLGRVSEPWLQDSGPGSKPNDLLAPSEDTQGNSFDGEKALRDLVSRSLSSIAVTLRERIELAVHQHDDVVLLFKAQNLLDFYHDLFAKLVGQTSPLSTTVQSLETTAQDHLHQVLAADNDTSWASDPIEGPMRHKENLATLEALFAVKAPDEMDAAQFGRFLEYYLGPAKDFAQIIQHAEKEPDNGGYSDIHLMFAIVMVTAQISFLSKSKVEADAYLNIMATFKDRQLLQTLEDAAIERVYNYMMAASGVEALIEEKIDASVVPKLPEYASQLDHFLRDGYSEIAGRFSVMDTREEERSIVAEAKEKFLEKLKFVVTALSVTGEEYREKYPRTMEDVEILLN